jgi:flagellar biosynthesis protein FlhB
MSSPTQSASPRRLQRARQAGDFPQSTLLKTTFIWGAGLCVLPSATHSLWTWGGDQIRRAIHANVAESNDFASAASAALTGFVKLSIPLLLVASVTAVAAHVAQARGFSIKNDSRWRLHRSGPWDRFAQLLSRRSLASQLLQVAAAATLAGYSWQWWRRHAVDVASTLGQASKARELSIITSIHLAWVAFIISLVMGGIDLLMSHRAWLQRLKPSRAEQQQEQRESEGDPLLKSRRASLRQELLVDPALTSLIDATVVVHARFQLTVSLRYVPSESAAPRVLQVAVRDNARRIIDESLRVDIAVVENSALATALARCEPGTPIPEVLFSEVAELLRDLAISDVNSVP